MDSQRQPSQKFGVIMLSEMQEESICISKKKGG